MGKVLLLNMSYEPFNICSWRRAIKLIIKGKAEQLEHNGMMLNDYYPCPSVIRLKSFIVVPYKEVSLKRKNILHRDDYTCQYCGKDQTELTIDHVIPRSRGGENHWCNVVAACVHCNNRKGNKTPREANMTLIKNPSTPKNKFEFEITKISLNPSLQTEWKKYLNFL